jgi:hypothetical protein
LKEYSGNLPLLLAGFFFWNPGTGMQKSREGLLRTLLYQCLLARRNLVPLVAPRRWALYNILGSDAKAPEWTWRELTESFERLCSYHGKEFQLALFIDGLDEFDGAERFPEVLVGWIKGAVQRHSIKVCVSSRPWNTFSDAFRNDRSLAMQALTKRDIRRFVHAQFDDNPAFVELKEVYAAEADELLGDIVDKAEGVFLWVSLVSRSLLSTLTDTPSIQHLQKVLAETPSDIMGLYDSIWRSIPSAKLASASKIFQLFRIQWHESSVTFWLAYEGPAVRASTVLDEPKIGGIAKLLKRLLDGHTRGLLESSSDRVEPLHRSVTDWMQREATWDHITRQTSADFDPALEFLESILTDASFKADMKIPTESTMIILCRSAFHYARLARLRPHLDERRLVKGLDAMDAFLSDKACVSYSTGTIITEVTVNSENPQHGCFSNRGWPSVQFHVSHIYIEVCFVGLAAAAGLVPYVKAKVKAHPELLLTGESRESLVESAVFPERRAYPETGEAGYAVLPSLGETRDQRLEIIRFLLGAADVRYTTALGKPLLNAVKHARSSSLRTRLDTSDYYDEVIRLLEWHGYVADPDEESRQDEKPAPSGEKDGTVSKPTQNGTKTETGSGSKMKRLLCCF